MFPLILMGLFLIYPTVNAAGLVPCGRNADDPSTPENEMNPCTTCDIFALGSRIINFFLFTLVPAIAVLLYLFAGFLILLGGANPGWVATGRTMFKNTTWGLIIIFAAWMITNSVLKSIAGNSLFTKDWNKVVCVESVPQPPLSVQRYACGSQGCVANSTGQYTEPTCGGKCPPAAVDKNLQNLAQSVLNSDIKLSILADCGGSFSARQNIQDMANGKSAAVCSPACNCVPGGPGGDIYLNPKILDGLLALNNWMKQQGITGGFTITSLTTGKHSANSAHYTGQAADIVPGSTNRGDWQRIRSFLNGYGGTAICEGSESNNVASCSGVNHIHWTFRF